MHETRGRGEGGLFVKETFRSNVIFCLFVEFPHWIKTSIDGIRFKIYINLSQNPIPINFFGFWYLILTSRTKATCQSQLLAGVPEKPEKLRFHDCYTACITLACFRVHNKAVKKLSIKSAATYSNHFKSISLL